MVEQTDDRVLEGANLAPSGPGTTVATMTCPGCGHENLQGDDECTNCGSDLRGADIPQATTPFEKLLVEMPLHTIQARPPFTVGTGTSVADVLARMRDQDTADVLVVEGDQLVGIFTERDALLKLRESGTADLGALDVADVMTADPVVLRPDDNLAVAIQKMAIGGFRHIPLVDDGRPIGVVSAADVFRHILRIAE